MEIHQRKLDGLPILDIVGEVDLYNARDLKDTLEALLNAKEFRLIVNLSKVPFMDSSGIGTLVTASYRAHNSNGKIAIAGASGSVLKVFKITSMESQFLMCNSVEEAVQGLLSD